MATVGVETKRPDASPQETCSAKPTKQGEGLRQYYLQHIHELQLHVRQKTHNLNRLEAQRNELNSRGLLFIFLITLTLISTVITPNWLFHDLFLLWIYLALVSIPFFFLRLLCGILLAFSFRLMDCSIFWLQRSNSFCLGTLKFVCRINYLGLHYNTDGKFSTNGKN